MHIGQDQWNNAASGDYTGSITFNATLTNKQFKTNKSVQITLQEKGLRGNDFETILKDTYHCMFCGTLVYANA